MNTRGKQAQECGFLKYSQASFMIATHPHEDHIGGLAGALNACSVGQIYSPVTEYDSDAFQALRKYAGKQGVELTVPEAGDVFYVGSASVQFISPSRAYENENDLSLVVRIVYGNTSFLFTGDAEWDAEHDMEMCRIREEYQKRIQQITDTSNYRIKTPEDDSL